MRDPDAAVRAFRFAAARFGTGEHGGEGDFFGAGFLEDLRGIQVLLWRRFVLVVCLTLDLCLDVCSKLGICRTVFKRLMSRQL